MDPDPENFINSILFQQIVRIVLLVVLLLFSALISGSEVALFSLQPSDLEVNDDSKKQRAINVIRELLNKPKKLLATILVANNFINIAIVLLFDALGGYFLHDIDNVVWGWLSVRFFIEVVLVTFLILLFGEILPKIYASRNNVAFAIYMAYPLRFLNKVLFFINSPMRYVTLKIHNQFGSQKAEINVSHLSQALEVTSDTDTSSDEKRILQGIVSFGNTDVRQVMCPRLTIFSLSSEETFVKAINKISEQGYSRVPIFEDTLDNVIGVLYVKDLLPYLGRKKFDWMELVRKPMFVPENKKLDDILTEFQEKKNHLAIVVDEYGGTSGLVTMDDIISEIVGDISDEYDDDLVYNKLNDANYIFDGRTHLKDFYKVTKLKNKEVFEEFKGEAETLAGFLLEISSNLPRKGEQLFFKNYIFKIESVDRKRIKEIKFTIRDAK
ncbi:gliding motility-associated protein GldE [Aquimarina agarilytica]|uniref:gliding motility-associated protein GldE n=1 Tax=Aquimarina agarilytica TaxID=1087449 RepID=UPI00028968F3|nr:gliding motility-associated protein GldE [Aquimarina agarilytica]